MFPACTACTIYKKSPQRISLPPWCSQAAASLFMLALEISVFLATTYHHCNSPWSCPPSPSLLKQWHVVCSLLMLALVTTTHVVNGEKITFVNCRVIIHLCYDYVSIASFLFDTHPNIILHASCLLLFKPSQLRWVVMVIAIRQG